MGRMGGMWPMGRMNKTGGEHGSALAASGLASVPVIGCFLWRGDGFAVEFDVFELQAERIANGKTAFSFDIDVFENDVAEGTLGKASEVAGAGTVLRREIADGNIAKGGSGLLRWRRFAKWFGQPGGTEGIHIEIEDLADTVCLNVFIQDIFDNSAAAHAGLQADDFAAAVFGAAVIDSH